MFIHVCVCVYVCMCLSLSLSIYIHIYIYICIAALPFDTGVCKEITPPEKKKGWKISSESTESGAGLQFLLPGRMAKARRKDMCCWIPFGDHPLESERYREY